MLGTGAFALPTFNGLLTSVHQVLALISRPAPPDIRCGRSTPAASPLLDAAKRARLPIELPESINAADAIVMLTKYRADLLVVCDYGQILSGDALATTRLGGINLHGSLLPWYRGAAPIPWALYDGQTETGVSVIHMTPRLDAGPCLVQLATPIDPDEDAVQLERRLAELGWQAVQKALDLLDAWDGTSPIGTPQNHAHATRAPRLKKSDGIVDWSRSATQIQNQVRAFRPWPGTFTYWRRAKGSLRLLLGSVAVDRAVGQLEAPGTVLEANGQRLVIACGQGTLRLIALQPAGKQLLSAREFLRGYPLRPNDMLRSSEG
jgi:methionyl-tRNA formyltransferase